MLSENEKESLTLLDAQDLQVCRALRNYYTGAICTVVDRKIPTNDLESFIGETLYELRKVDDTTYPSFIISASALFNLYQYALNEEGRRYCIACFNYEKDNDEKLSKNEEENIMKTIKLEELTVGQSLKATKDVIIKGKQVIAGEYVSVKKLYTDKRLSLRKDSDNTVISAVTEKLLNQYFEVVGAPVETKIQTELDLKPKSEIDLEEVKTFVGQEIGESGAGLTAHVCSCGNGLGCGGCIAEAVAQNAEVDFDFDKKYDNIEIEPYHADVVRAFVNGRTTIVIITGGFKGVSKCFPAKEIKPEDSDRLPDAFSTKKGYDIAYAKAKLKKENRAFKEFNDAIEYSIEDLTDMKKKRASLHNKVVATCESVLSFSVSEE